MKTRVFALVVCLGIASAVFMAGCASIMHGTSQDVGISSTPTGATITVDGQIKGTTPAAVKLSRKDTHTVKIELPGYLPFESMITRHVSGWVWGNIIFGGLIGLAVDAMTGGLYKLSPEQLQATLAKENAGILYNKDAIYVSVVLQADPSWKQIGNLVPQQ